MAGGRRMRRQPCGRGSNHRPLPPDPGNHLFDKYRDYVNILKLDSRRESDAVT